MVGLTVRRAYENTMGTVDMLISSRGADLHETDGQEKLYDKVRDLEKFEEGVVGRELERIKLKRELQDTKHY